MISFTKSILATICLFAAVWGAVFLNTDKYADSLSSGEFALSKAVESDSIEIVGIKKEIGFGDDGDQIKALWETFYEENELHMVVEQEASRRVFAYYEFTNADLSSANVIIGYNTKGEEIPGYSDPFSISIKAYDKIYQSNESWDTTAAWNKIDENRKSHSVLEEYLMGAGGDVVSTRVYILYK